MVNKLKFFKIALICGSIDNSNKDYYAQDEQDCIDLFLKNNPDLDETDIWVKEIKENSKVSGGKDEM